MCRTEAMWKFAFVAVLTLALIAQSRADLDSSIGVPSCAVALQTCQGLVVLHIV